MVTSLVKEWVRRALEPLVHAIAATGISPNALTLIGFGLSAIVAVVLALGYHLVGGFLVLAAGLFDMLDGAVARANGHASRFGALLDSTVDRFSEAVLLFGLVYFYAQRGLATEVLLLFATLAGSVMVSYVRARAEGLGLSCEVGLLARPERVFILAAGLVTGYLLIALWVLAVLTNATALQRLYHVWRITRGEAEAEKQALPEAEGASSSGRARKGDRAKPRPRLIE